MTRQAYDWLLSARICQRIGDGVLDLASDGDDEVNQVQHTKPLFQKKRRGETLARSNL